MPKYYVVAARFTDAPKGCVEYNYITLYDIDKLKRKGFYKKLSVLFQFIRCKDNLH